MEQVSFVIGDKTFTLPLNILPKNSLLHTMATTSINVNKNELGQIILKCEVNEFIPGDSLKFNNFKIKTIPFQGHSKAHVGFLLPEEKLLHISCLGFDKERPEVEGFGPWYGFKQCSIEQYFKDIELAEKLFNNDIEFLTSSHSYIIKHPDSSPFNYMRNKIQKNQDIVDNAIKELHINKSDDQLLLDKLLEMDLFFPKKKLKGVVFDIYRFWESWIIRKHIQRSKYF